MADSTVRVTLVWGEMKLEFEGDAAPTIAELQNFRANGLGRLADFFALRSPLGSQRYDPTAPIPSPQQPVTPPAPLPPAAHPARQLLITRLQLPTTAAEAAGMAVRHGSAGTPKGNVVGGALAAVSQALALDLSSLVATPAPSIWLAEFNPASVDTPQATLTLRGGLDRPDAPGTYAVDPSFTPRVFSGTTSGDTFVSADSSAPAGPLVVAIAPTLLMGVEIHEPYLELNLAAPALIGGKLCGLTKVADFRESLAQALGGYVAGELSSNPSSDAARALRALFLTNAADPDNVPTGVEMAAILRGHTLITSLLTPDTSLTDGSPALSVALAFVARPLAR